jgi:hypothetical protein
MQLVAMREARLIPLVYSLPKAMRVPRLLLHASSYAQNDVEDEGWISLDFLRATSAEAQRLTKRLPLNQRAMRPEGIRTRMPECTILQTQE